MFATRQSVGAIESEGMSWSMENKDERGFEFAPSLWNIQMEFISLFHMFRLFCVI